MAEGDNLTRVFVEAHPAEAARVVETMPSDAAAAFMASIGPRLGAPLLAAMLPPAAARILLQVDEAHALALLGAASTQAVVAILRHVPEATRARLLAELPPAIGLAAQLLLGFPDDAVGAWTDPEVLGVAANTASGEVLERVRASGTAPIDAIFVTDSARHLQGEVSLQALLRAPATTPVSALMQPASVTLPAMMPIAAAVSLGAWQRIAVLPVIDHDKRLLGVLRRARLAQAARERGRPGRGHPADASVTGVLAGSYWAIVSGLIGAALALLPQVKRVYPDER